MLAARRKIGDVPRPGTAAKPDGDGESKLIAVGVRGVRERGDKGAGSPASAGKIGSALQAAVCADGDPKLNALAGRAGDDDLRFIVLQPTWFRMPRGRWRALSHAKCERCWHRRDDVGADAAASRALRPLRQQPAGGRRPASQLCLSTAAFRLVRLGDHRPRPDQQVGGPARFLYLGETRCFRAVLELGADLQSGRGLQFRRRSGGWQRWFFTVLACWRFRPGWRWGGTLRSSVVACRWR